MTAAADVYCAGITALSLLITPFLLQACRHILQDGADTLSPLPSVSLPVSSAPLPHPTMLSLRSCSKMNAPPCAPDCMRPNEM